VQGHWSKKDHENNDTGMLAKGKPGLAKVKTGGSIYVQMPKVMKAITISDDSASNEDPEQEQESKQQPKDKRPVVETDKDEEDEDEDDKYQEDDYMPYITQGTVDGYLVSIIGHLEKYT